MDYQWEELAEYHLMCTEKNSPTRKAFGIESIRVTIEIFL